MITASDQWRSVADEPDVPERINEVALPMGSPGRVVILDVVKTTCCTRFQGACDHGVRVIAEHFDPRGRNPKLRGTFPTVVRRFPQEKRRTSNRDDISPPSRPITRPCTTVIILFFERSSQTNFAEVSHLA